MSPGRAGCSGAARPAAAVRRHRDRHHRPRSRGTGPARRPAAEIGTSSAKLPAPARKAVRREVAEVVDRWWDAAYVGGTYPRTGFRDGFPGFTPGASRARGTTGDLMTNADTAPRIDSVTPLQRTVALDMLAIDRQVRSVTAQFVLRSSTTTGAGTGTDGTVRGRLFLTRTRRAWRVFGYDVAKGAR